MFAMTSSPLRTYIHDAWKVSQDSPSTLFQICFLELAQRNLFRLGWCSFWCLAVSRSWQALGLLFFLWVGETLLMCQWSLDYFFLWTPSTYQQEDRCHHSCSCLNHVGLRYWSSPLSSSSYLGSTRSWILRHWHFIVVDFGYYYNYSQKMLEAVDHFSLSVASF